MSSLPYEERQQILDFFGEILIGHVRDTSLRSAMHIVRGTINPVVAQQYKVLLTLTHEQQEAVCDLLSQTITDTIYNFLDMFEFHEDEMKLLVYKDGKEYDLSKVTEKMGGEIAFNDADGWIQKFSKIGRFVL